MITATPAGTAPDEPYTGYTPHPKASKEEIAYCTSCPIPDGCDFKHPLCQYSPAYQGTDDLGKQIARHLHQIVNTPVYRAHRGIVRELGR